MEISRLIRSLKVSIVIFLIAAAVISPPDVISQVTIAVEMIIVYVVLIFVVSRFKSLAQTPESIKKLIFVLVCLLSITIVYCATLFQYLYHAKTGLREQRTSSTTQVQAVESQ